MNFIVKCVRGTLSQMLVEDSKDKIVVNAKEPMVFGSREAAEKTVLYLVRKTGQRFWVEEMK